MTRPVEPVSAAGSQTGVDAVGPRHGDRRQGDRRKPAGSQTTAVVPTGVEVKTSAKPACVPAPPPAAFAAQVLGQPGKKRGLKGGPEVLDAARSTYLSREFSGSKDRRPSPGVRRKAEI